MRESTTRRLDELEVQLTPKEWAIRLAEEMRRHPSEKDFWKSLAKGTYRETPFVKPFFKLAEQAEKRHHAKDAANSRLRNRLNRDLRREFAALRGLLWIINDEMDQKAELIKLRAAVKLSRLHSIVLLQLADLGREQDTKSSESPTKVDGKEIRGFGASWHGGEAIGRLIDELSGLIIELFAYKRAIQTTQELYFGGRCILFRDVEERFEETVSALSKTADAFNGYAQIISHYSDKVDQDDKREKFSSARHCNDGPAIDLKALRKIGVGFSAECIAKDWASRAKQKATADILKETQQHEPYVWQTFQQRVES